MDTDRSGHDLLNEHADAEPRYELEDGSVWLRIGECSHCGWCCRDCELHDKIKMRCTEYGGETYKSLGCPTWPDVSRRDLLPPECTYDFVRIK